MDNWSPMSVVPNIEVEEAFGDDNIALVPTTDGRFISALNQQPKLGDFIGRFTDQFGGKIEPSAVIVRDKSLSLPVNSSAISSFRDIIAGSVITNVRSGAHPGYSAQALRWSDTFDFYPWMLDRRGVDLVINTPANYGKQSVMKFQGQSCPGIQSTYLHYTTVNHELFDALMAVWGPMFLTKIKREEDIKVVRSLNMAFSALRMPGSDTFEFYDIGRLLALLVSACEILVHPGSGGFSDSKLVVDKLLNIKYISEKMNKKIFTASTHNKGKLEKFKTKLSAKHYYAINKLRNKYLHGNDVSNTEMNLGVHSALTVASSIYFLLLWQALGISDYKVSSIEDPNVALMKVGRNRIMRETLIRHEGILLGANR